MVGLIGGTYGIGGGAIIAPFLAAIFKLPMYTIAGAALLGTLVTSIAGVGIYSIPSALRPRIWAPGGPLRPGRFLRHVYRGPPPEIHFSGKVIRIGLGFVISGLALRYILGFFTG